MFADDTTLIACSNSLKDLQSMLNKDLDSLSIYCNENTLFLNIKKCKVMIFSPNKSCSLNLQNYDMKVGLNHTYFEVVDVFKFLGYFIDSNLSFNQNTEHI